LPESQLAGLTLVSNYFKLVTAETILADYTDLEPHDLRACLAYAHAAISHDKLDALNVPA
jgi:uncharacterized protein (DUF433 family)